MTIRNSKAMMGMALTAAALAGHLALGACGGGGVPVAHADGGGGAGTGTCECTLPAPKVYEVPCVEDTHDHGVAELSLPGKSAADLATVTAVGHFNIAKDDIGHTIYPDHTADVYIANERVAVACEYMIGSGRFYTTVTFTVR